MRTVSACLLTLCLTSSAFAQTNEQTFYNKTLFSLTTATRATTTQIDKIFFTQPVDFRRSYGMATGWRIVLQDQNPQTAEQVHLAYHSLAFQSTIPNKAEVFGANFTAFGGGSSGPKSFIYTFTVNTAFAVPEFLGMSATLPAAHSWPNDAVTMHFQRGDRTKVAVNSRSQWTYELLGNSVVAQWRKGSSFRFGGLYTKPVLQAFNGSNAYGGAAQDLTGPESQIFATGGARQDSLGFRAEGGVKYKSLGNQLSVAGVFFSADYRGSALPLPPFGTLLIDENTATFLAYMVMDKFGRSRTLTAVVPPNVNLRLAWQAIFVSIDTSSNTIIDFELSNGVRTFL